MSGDPRPAGREGAERSEAPASHALKSVALDGAVRLRTEGDITHDLKSGFGEARRQSSAKRGDKMCAQDNVVVHNAMRMSVLAVAD
jgi:hypothetical protein